MSGILGVLTRQSAVNGGVYVAGAKLFVYDAGTATKRAIYTTSALSVQHSNPLVADSNGRFAAFWIDSDGGSYKEVLALAADTDPPSSPIWTDDNIPAIVSYVASYAQTAAEIAAGVTPTDDQYPELNLRRYGGAPGAADNTAAMNAAESVIDQKGGGEIILDHPGPWLMNWVCTTRAVSVRGQGGAGEYDLYVVRPYSITSAPITWGDGTADTYYGRLFNLHVSGSDSSASGDTNAANNAPSALLLKSVVNFRAVNCVFYNGLKTVSLTPSATNPVTGVHLRGCAIRSDITDSTASRCFYGERLADPGYFTDNPLIGTKINKSGDGYAIELKNNGGPGIVGDFMHVYCDHRPGYGLLLSGAGASVRCHELQLDPGTTGVVVISTDEAQDSPTRFISGSLRHGGQKMEFDVGGSPVEIVLPAEAERFGYRDLLQLPKIIGPINFTTTTDPYDASTAKPAIDTDSATGPLTVLRADLSIKTVGKGLRIAEGSNARQGVATLVAGSVVVSNTTITANTRIDYARQDVAGTPGHLSVSRLAGTSFTISSTEGTETSDIAWWLTEPA